MLKIDSLSFKSHEKFLIKNISLEFYPGLIYGIIGPNGSGKTTLLKILTGIWKASSGQVLWQEKDFFSFERQQISQIISLVPQNPQIHFDFTVSEVVEMGTYPCRSLSSQERKKRTQEALELVDALHLRNRQATHISHGERQRIYIARSLATHSPILILDEPTSNLDIRHQIEIWELLLRLKNENKTIIIANHDLHAAKQYCDQIAVLNQGHCVAKGSFTQVMTPDFISSIFGVEEILSKPEYRSVHHASVIT